MPVESLRDCLLYAGSQGHVLPEGSAFHDGGLQPPRPIQTAVTQAKYG